MGAVPASGGPGTLLLPSRKSSMSGRLVARTVFGPSPAIQYVTRDATAYVDVDPDHLIVEFDAPASGLVKVVMSGTSAILSSTAAMYWGLRGTGGRGRDNVIPGSEIFLATGMRFKRDTVYSVLLRVEPGAAYSWTWAYKSGAPLPGSRPIDSATFVKIDDNLVAGHGPGMMEVWDTDFSGILPPLR
jgi:hypothetical protein